MFQFGAASIENLNECHPDLIKVLSLAIQKSKIDFGVAKSTKRTKEEQEEFVRTGKSKTMDSLHLIQKDGYRHAADIFAFIDGKVSYDAGKLRLIGQAIVTAAIECGVKIRLGMLWDTFMDMPHIELDRAYYK